MSQSVGQRNQSFDACMKRRKVHLRTSDEIRFDDVELRESEEAQLSATEESKREQEEADLKKELNFRSTMERLELIARHLDKKPIQEVNQLILQLPRVPREIRERHEENEEAIRTTEDQIMKLTETEDLGNESSGIFGLDVGAERSEDEHGATGQTLELLNQMICNARSKMDEAERSGNPDEEAQIFHSQLCLMRQRQLTLERNLMEERRKALEERRKALEERRKALEERRKALEERRKALLRNWFTSMKDATGKVHHQLTILVGLNQNDPPPTETFSTTMQAEALQRKRELAELENEDLLPLPQQDWTHVVNGLISQEPFDPFPEQHVDQNLRHLHHKFQKRVAETSCLVTNSCKGDTALPDGFAQTFFKSLKDDASCEDIVYFPGPKAAEVQFSQPYLEELLYEIGQLTEEIVEEGKDLNTKSVRASPNKSYICKNRPVPQFGLRRRRVADKSLVPGYSRFKFLCPDHAVEIRIEEKRGERSNTKPEEMFTEAVAQAVAHLAKFVSVGFNFAGHGVDTFATGLVLCPAYVAAVQVELVGIGTMDIRLEVRVSARYPLLSPENLKKWCEHSSHKNAWKKFEFAPKDSISGWFLLWRVMHCQRRHLFGPRVDICTDDDDVGEIIAYGGFATIHNSKKENTDCAIKVSRFGTKAYIENEVNMLRVLANANGHRSKNVPELVSPDPSSNCTFNRLNLLLGETRVPIPSLTIRPLGIPILNFVHSTNEELLTHVGKDIGDALRFIHDHNIVHLDVSPRNIIFKQYDDETSAVILVDFGLASYLKTPKKGIHGTLAFMPKDILEKYPDKGWSPMKVHDWISLGLTMAALKHFFVNSTMSLPWKVPSSHKMDLESFVNDRNECAQCILDGTPHIEWREWVNGNCME